MLPESERALARAMQAVRETGSMSHDNLQELISVTIDMAEVSTIGACADRLIAAGELRAGEMLLDLRKQVVAVATERLNKWKI